MSTCAWSDVTLYAGVYGTVTSYQWRKNSVNLSDGGNVSGTRTALLKLS